MAASFQALWVGRVDLEACFEDSLGLQGQEGLQGQSLVLLSKQLWLWC